MVGLLWLLACGSVVPATSPSVALPPSAMPKIEALRVKSGDVQGYLVRPTDHGRSWPAVLMLVEDLNPETLGLARAEAGQGAILLAVDVRTDGAAARDYLMALPSVSGEPRVVCLRQANDCVSQGP